MEAFTLLKYPKPTEATPQPQPPPPKEEDTDYIETTTDEEGEEEDEPFFDIEFTVPDEEEEQEQEEQKPNEFENELGFTLSPLTNEQVQLELNSSEPNSKPQFTASFLKSATKLRVFMSGFNKSKSTDSTAQKPESQKKKLFTVKFKVDEVPFGSFFTRDNSSKGKTGADNNKASEKKKKQHNTEEEESKLHSPSSASSDEKLRFSKEVMQKYLKKVKPLYVKVSRKYAEKLKFSSSQLNSSLVKKPPAEKVRSENGGNNVKSQKQGTLPLPAGLRVVCKHLGKSRSASLATEVATVSSQRRDDSTMQQQDGIQSAILHCKSSFNASKECNPLQSESSRKLGNELEDEGGFLK
ncbi:unnamed protein product [Lathyrus sativus]|nr:unnamed protein product [Lathyrus sativus]